MKDRVAIVSGVRTPFCKAGGVMNDFSPDDLGAFIVSELLIRTGVSGKDVDELIFGNVLQPPQSLNIARIIAIKAGLPVSTPAFTVNRNCASGLEAITNASDKILLKEAGIIIAGGVESMSNFPVLVNKQFKNFLQRFNKAKGWRQRLSALLTFRFGFIIPEQPDIADPLCGLNMGQTAEVLAREFGITRREQDQFALLSQHRATQAINEGYFIDEIAPVPLPPRYDTVQVCDDGPRENQTLDALSKLKPSFDPVMGTVTAGNASQISDGAAAVLLMSESKAKAMGLEPLGYIKDYAVAGLQPHRMGLGAAFALAKLLDQTKMQLSDFDLIEVNEAFAVQVLAVVKACASTEFARKEFGRDRALGVIEMEKLNVNSGAIALGHPLGASGTRLVLTLLRELKRRGKNLGVATLCVGGGQGQSIAVEVN